MREQEVRYHFMAEVQRKGWDHVMKQALEEAKDGTEYLFLSIDLDAFDPAFAPGAGTPEPGGLTPRELLPLIRGLCTENEIVGFDVVEVNPIVDDYNTTALLANRTIRDCLAGMALRKKGITDPHYLHPELVDHD